MPHQVSALYRIETLCHAASSQCAIPHRRLRDAMEARKTSSGARPRVGSQDGGDMAAAIILDQEVCGSLVGLSPRGMRGVGIVGTRGLHFPQVVTPPHHQTFFCHSNSFPSIRELSVIQVYTPMMRVGAYIDGLNLHYGGRHLCGHETPGWRWLDVAKLVERLLGRNRAWAAQKARVHRIVFCTSVVSGHSDALNRQKQMTYLAALDGDPRLKVEKGHFKTRTIRGADIATGALHKPMKTSAPASSLRPLVSTGGRQAGSPPVGGCGLKIVLALPPLHRLKFPHPPGAHLGSISSPKECRVFLSVRANDPRDPTPPTIHRRNSPSLRPSPHPPSRRPHLGSPPLNPLVRVAPGRGVAGEIRISCRVYRRWCLFR